jgi:hypothetical protein
MSNKNRGFSPAIISNFEIFGCFFVDLFYNQVYARARHIKMGTSDDERQAAYNEEGITSIYRRQVVALVRGLKTDNSAGIRALMKDTVLKLVNNYQKHTGHTAMTITEFQDVVLGAFLPVDHTRTLGPSEKNFFLNKIIISIIERFSAEILQPPNLRMVIDDHKNQKNTRVWQDIILDVQKAIHDEFYTQFARKELGLSAKDDRTSTEVGALKSKMAAMTNVLRQTLQDKCRLEAELERARAVVKSIYADMQAAPANGYKAQATSYTEPTNDYSEPTNGYKLPTNGYKLPTNGYKAPANIYTEPTGRISKPTSAPVVANNNKSSAELNQFDIPESKIEEIEDNIVEESAIVAEEAEDDDFADEEDPLAAARRKIAAKQAALRAADITF